MPRSLFKEAAKGNIAASIFLAKNLLGYRDAEPFPYREILELVAIEIEIEKYLEVAYQASSAAKPMGSFLFTGSAASNGITYAYDSEGRLLGASAGVQLIYDGDGNRVSATAGGVTTKFLI